MVVSLLELEEQDELGLHRGRTAGRSARHTLRLVSDPRPHRSPIAFRYRRVAGKSARSAR